MTRFFLALFVGGLIAVPSALWADDEDKEGSNASALLDGEEAGDGEEKDADAKPKRKPRPRFGEFRKRVLEEFDEDGDGKLSDDAPHNRPSAMSVNRLP